MTRALEQKHRHVGLSGPLIFLTLRVDPSSGSDQGAGMGV